MFWGCKEFNQDLYKWKVYNVKNMSNMFGKCKSFNKDISNWDVSNVINSYNMFVDCPIEEKYKPNFR